MSDQYVIAGVIREESDPIRIAGVYDSEEEATQAAEELNARLDTVVDVHSGAFENHVVLIPRFEVLKINSFDEIVKGYRDQVQKIRDQGWAVLYLDEGQA